MCLRSNARHTCTSPNEFYNNTMCSSFQYMPYLLASSPMDFTIQQFPSLITYPCYLEAAMHHLLLAVSTRSGLLTWKTMARSRQASLMLSSHLVSPRIASTSTSSMFHERMSDGIELHLQVREASLGAFISLISKVDT